MTIVMAGGGSGGHITPVLAVAHEVKRQSPETRVVYIGQRGDAMRDVVAAHDTIDGAPTIYAGKFRRYNGESVLHQLLDIPTVLKNIRDVFLAFFGTVQAYFLLGRIKPAAVFLKGGYVGVPVGLAAAARRIPIITHDSDALPGLANRLVSRWAAAHAVGLPKEFYAYPPDRTHYVGVPVSPHFEPVTKELTKAYRHDLEIPQDALVVTVTGGGLGAQRLNEAIRSQLPALFQAIPKLYVIGIVGRQNETAEREAYNAMTDIDQTRVRVLGFVTDMYRYTGAADIVVTRAGATSMAELAIQRKACVVVPNPFLTGGHQLKNAQELAKTQAVRLVSEEQLANTVEDLTGEITDLAEHPAEREALAATLAKLAKTDAASELAAIILDIAQGGGVHAETVS